MEQKSEKAPISKEDIVRYTINILTGITIPAMQGRTTGAAIESAVNNLIVLQEMMQQEAARAAAEPGKGEAEDGNADV